MAKSPNKQLSGLEVFSRNLRRARLLRDLSQEELALEAGLHRNFVGEVEREAKNVSLKNMDLLAHALKVPLRDLVDPEKFVLDEN